MTFGALLLVASTALSPHAATCAAALDTVYDGSTGAGVARLAQLNAATPDLLCAYMELLARVWLVEQAPDGAKLDADFHRRAEALVARADERLRARPDDMEARFVRGASHGVESRLHLFRLERRPAIRTAVAMRADLQEIPERHALFSEAQFGLGLYDYYADVLPRVLKLLRFIVGLPAGDRARGLARMETARLQAVVHKTEAQVQLLDAYVYYEGRDDDSLDLLRDLHRRYPHAPLWGLRLAEHQRERLGLYAESAATARDLLAAAERGETNFAPVVGGMARVLLAEARLLEYRPEEAQAAVQAPLPLDSAPNWAARAHLVHALALEQRGQHGQALAHYRVARLSDDAGVRERAQAGMRAGLDTDRRRAFALLAEARARRDAGRARDAATLYAQALEAWPGSQEAALRVAEDELLAGRWERADTRLRPLLQDGSPEPPWVKPWARLLAARLADLRGHRADALQQYNEVSKHPLGSTALRDWAVAGLAHPFTLASPTPER